MSFVPVHHSGLGLLWASASGRVGRLASAGLGALLLLWAQLASAQYVPVPLPLTGWNADLIAEPEALNPYAGTSGDLANGWDFFCDGVPNAPPGYGFPTNNLLTSGSGLQATFVLQPYNANNALRLAGDTPTATLALTTPTRLYNALDLLVAGVNNPTWTVTLNFTDSTSTSYAAAVPDWTQAGPGAKTLGLVNNSDTSWPTWPADGARNYYPVYLQECDIALTVCDSAKAVQSITFTLAGGQALAIFGAAAQTNSPPVVPPATNATIIRDAFSGNFGDQIIGRTPDSADLPAVVYTVRDANAAYQCCNNITNRIDTTRGNPPPAVGYGFDNYSGLSIASVQGVYTKPTHFRISADLQESSIGGSDTVRGMLVGFSSAGGPNNVIGHQGANNVNGLWLTPDFGGQPVIVLQNFGESYLNWTLAAYTNHIIATYSAALLGPYSGSRWYTLAYEVDTVLGSITNITLSAGGATQFIAGTFGTSFTDAHTMYAFVGSSGSGTTDRPAMDNLAVIGLPDLHNPSAQPQIIEVARIGNDIQLWWTALGGTASLLEAAPAPTGDFTAITANLRNPGCGTITTNSYTERGAATLSAARFYRVKLAQ